MAVLRDFSRPSVMAKSVTSCVILSLNRDSNGLREHYVEAHHPCREGECAESGLVAFATEQELKDHQLERHSSKMPRFKK
jgi:hypothetical protein